MPKFTVSNFLFLQQPYQNSDLGLSTNFFHEKLQTGKCNRICSIDTWGPAEHEQAVIRALQPCPGAAGLEHASRWAEEMLNCKTTFKLHYKHQNVSHFNCCISRQYLFHFTPLKTTWSCLTFALSVSSPINESGWYCTSTQWFGNFHVFRNRQKCAQAEADWMMLHSVSQLVWL